MQQYDISDHLSLYSALGPLDETSSTTFAAAHSDWKQRQPQTLDEFHAGGGTNRNIMKVVTDQKKIALKQHALMTAAGLSSSSSAGLSPSSKQASRFKHLPSVSPRLTMALSRVSASLLSSGNHALPPWPPIDGDVVMDDAGSSGTMADPWRKRGKPQALWEPGSSVNTPQKLFLGGFSSSPSPDAYIQEWLHKSSSKAAYKNSYYDEGAGSEHLTFNAVTPRVSRGVRREGGVGEASGGSDAWRQVPEDLPSMPTYFNSKIALEDVESSPAKPRSYR